MYLGLPAAIPVIGLVGYAGLLIVVLRRGLQTPLFRAFAAYLLSMLVASVGALGMFIDPQRALLWNKVMLGGLVTMPMAFYTFVRIFLGGVGGDWEQYPGWVLMLGLQVANGVGWLTEYVYFTQSGLIRYQFGPAVPFYALYFFGYVGAAGYRLIRARQLSQNATERNRYGYALLGMLVVFLGSLTNVFPSLGAYPLDIASHIINALLLGYAISRYQLLDIGLVVRRGLYYVFPAAIMGAGYFLITYLAVNLFRVVSGEFQVIALAVVVAGVTAAVVHFLGDEVQAWMDRLLFRRRYDVGLMLQKISRSATVVLDSADLSEMILQEIADTMRVAKAAFLLKREASGEFRVVAQRGLESGVNSLALRPDHPVLRWLSGHGDVLTRMQLDAAPQFRALWAEERADLEAMEAELFVPLMVRDNLVGVLILGPKQMEWSYTLDEQQTLTTLANQTAVAVENARLFSHSLRRAREASSLLEIAQAVGSTLHLTNLLQIMAQKTAEVCGVERCTILLLNESGERLIPLMSQYHDGRVEESLWQSFRESTYVERVDSVPVVSRVLKQRQPFVIGSEGLAALPQQWIEPFGIKSMLAVPLISKDKVIGLMALDHTRPGQTFTDEQVNLATTISSQVSIAVENARLYEQVVDEKDRTQTILEQAFAGIMVVDADLRVVIANPGAQAITGYGPDEILGKRWPDLFGPELCSDGSALQRALSSGQQVAPEEAILLGKRGPRDVLLGITSLRDGLLLSLADITQLKDVDRLKSNIVANVSHELRAPLASIKAYTELLLDDLSDGYGSARRFLSVIDRESDRLAALINDLLDISRLERGRFELHKSPLVVDEVISDTVALLRVQAEMRRIEIQLDVPDGLPVVYANRDLLMTLVKNLLSNAIKFSHEGGRVQLRARVEGPELLLDFVDRGMGIGAEDVPHLFEKFHRAETAIAAGIKGTGLGLVLAQEAVQAHGGTIEVETELGVGSRFTAILPIASPMDAREKAVGSDTPETEHGHGFVQASASAHEAARERSV